uniref:Uncharacterized protein n=1 Tax=Salarias fasciatus TaxID=181472 RepID=A0A672JBK4_SALFA
MNHLCCVDTRQSASHKLSCAMAKKTALKFFFLIALPSKLLMFFSHRVSEDFMCRDRRSCISRNVVCDGRSHCRDGSDEVDCSTVAPLVTQASILKCRLGSKPCSDGTGCVLYSHVCDGEEDCRDGSDELECGEFSKVEIRHLVVVCDGRSDCYDGSDEVACSNVAAPQTTLKCRLGSRSCRDGTECVLYSHVCDGEKDCRDGSDELGCGAY